MKAVNAIASVCAVAIISWTLLLGHKPGHKPDLSPSPPVTNESPLIKADFVTPWTNTREFVSVTNLHGQEFRFRPHMVITITGNSTTSSVDVAGIGWINLDCPIEKAASLVRAGLCQ